MEYVVLKDSLDFENKIIFVVIYLVNAFLHFLNDSNIVVKYF